MRALVVIAYPGESDAAARFEIVRRWVEEGLLTLDDAAYVTVDAEGAAHLHQGLLTAASGATAGAFFGAIIGLLVPAPLIGAMAGAAIGGLTGRLADYGIPDEFVRDVGAHLQPQTSALFLLVIGAALDRLLPQVHELGGRVLHTTLPPQAEARLRAALSGDDASSARR